VLQSTKMKRIRDLKSILTSGMEIQGLESAQQVFGLALVQYFFTMLPFGTVMYILCHYEFKVCDLWFDFDCIAGYS
jgi:flagellar biosynthesis protein FliP